MKFKEDAPFRCASSTMTKADIHQTLQAQYSLDDMVCIADIETVEQLKEYEAQGYEAGFTRSQFMNRFPHIAVEHIYCIRTTFVPVGLIYLDEEQYICIHTSLFGGKDITNKTDEEFEKVLSEIINRRIEAVRNKEYHVLFYGMNSEDEGNIQMRVLHNLIKNEKPCKEIYQSFVDVYSFCDCGIAQISLEDVKRVCKGKSKGQQDETLKRMSQLPDIITIYRGEGSSSTPYENAFSWTTDINTAYFFAYWRHSKSFRLVTGTVNKMDVIEYLTDRGESEVIVLPENVTASQRVQCNVDWFVTAISSDYAGFPAFEYNAADIKMKVKELYDAFGISSRDHDWKHSCRVAFYASFLFRCQYFIEHMSAQKKTKAHLIKFYNELMQAAIWHDVSRESDECHGVASYAVFKENNPDDEIIQFLVENHNIDDEDAKVRFKECFNSYSSKDRKIIWNMFCMLKDADALDRLRIDRMSKDCLDVKRLRLEESLDIVCVAGALQDMDF